MAHRHTLFILAGADAGATRAGVEVLSYVQKVKPTLGKVGISIEVKKVPAHLLSNTKLLASFREKGVTAFPALKTPKSVYIGAARIVEVYGKVVAAYAQKGRPGPAAAASGDDDDPYRQFVGHDLSFGAADQDRRQGEAGVGEENVGSMMARYHEMIKARKQRMPGVDEAFGGPADHSPVPAPHSRPDNLNPAEHSQLNSILSSMAGSAPAASVGDSVDRAFTGARTADEARDDELMRLFWDKNEESY